MNVKIVRWTPGRSNKAVDTFVQRPAFDEKAEEAARKVLQQIKRKGAPAIVQYARQFDGAKLTPATLRVSESDIAAATKQVDAAFRRAANESRRRITAFAKKSMKKNWKMKTPGGGLLGEVFQPFERIGAYIPGGEAPLVSTALMTMTLAKVAGVNEIVACTPCGKDGRVNPTLLYTMHLAGATEIYRVGGIQSIGLMAYGTDRIAPVQKIVGPGGAYVTAAKRCVYGDVALDLVAGPSEIAVLTDSTAKPAWVAADLLSQAEHGTGHEKALLVTTSRKQAEQVLVELKRQNDLLTRRDHIAGMAEKGILLVVVKNLDHAAQLVNDFAPEHLEIMTATPMKTAGKITCAGAIFIGEWTPESAGDFVAGPSHVLPTGGAARKFSGLTVDDFLRRSSVIAFTRKDLQQTLPVIEAFGRVEDLDAHARSAVIRFKDI
jgi:histidinol dehydrogenase